MILTIKKVLQIIVGINLWKSMRIKIGISFFQSYSFFIPEINRLYTNQNAVVIINIIY